MHKLTEKEVIPLDIPDADPIVTYDVPKLPTEFKLVVALAATVLIVSFVMVLIT